MYCATVVTITALIHVAELKTLFPSYKYGHSRVITPVASITKVNCYHSCRHLLVIIVMDSCNDVTSRYSDR